MAIRQTAGLFSWDPLILLEFFSLVLFCFCRNLSSSGRVVVKWAEDPSLEDDDFYLISLFSTSLMLYAILPQSSCNVGDSQLQFLL
jgi:hypothetical protein